LSPNLRSKCEIQTDFIIHYIYENNKTFCKSCRVTINVNHIDTQPTRELVIYKIRKSCFQRHEYARPFLNRCTDV